MGATNVVLCWSQINTTHVNFELHIHVATRKFFFDFFLIYFIFTLFKEDRAFSDQR